MSTAKDAKLVVDDTAKASLAKARHADSGPDYFVVFKYQGGAGTTLITAAEGPGGWDEAAKSLDNADAGYVFLRKDHKVEMAKTVKFAFVDWFPNGMKAMRRIQVSALKKSVADLCKPTHVELSASDLTDVTQKMIDDRIGFVSGTASHIKGKGDTAAAAPADAAPAAEAKDAPAAAAAAPVAAEKKWTPKPASEKPAPKPVTSSGSGGLKWTDSAAFDVAIKAVRNDKSDTNWLVASYGATDTLSLTGSGADGFDGLMAAIADDGIFFGLLRVVEVIDDKSKTTKFMFIRHVPDSVKPMKRAEITTRAGAIEKVFGQAHVSFDISKKSELTEAEARKKLGNASGSASNVVAKK